MKYKVRRDIKSLQECGGKIASGEIVIHRSGNLLLNCPACDKIQFVTAKLEGSDEAPDIIKPIQCGSGYCQRCGIWFRVVTGQSELVEVPDRRSTLVIPKNLEVAGVTKPPEQIE